MKDRYLTGDRGKSLYITRGNSAFEDGYLQFFNPAFLLHRALMVHQERSNHQKRVFNSASFIENPQGGGIPTRIYKSLPSLSINSFSDVGGIRPRNHSWRNVKYIQNHSTVALLLIGPRPTLPVESSGSDLASGLLAHSLFFAPLA